MCLVLPDDILRAAGVSEQEARLELACALFAAGRLDVLQAASLALVSRAEMEAALRVRKVPLYRYTIDEIRAEVETLRKAGY